MKSIHLSLLATLLIVFLVSVYSCNTGYDKNSETSFTNDAAILKACCEKMGFDYESCKKMTSEQCMEMCKTMMDKFQCPDSTMMKVCMENE